MHGIEDGNRHEKNRDHRAHDMDGKTKPDQKHHRHKDGRDSQDHRRDNQLDGFEEKPHQKKNDEAGKRRGDSHLLEHLHPELVLGHRQAGDMVFFIAGVFLCNDLDGSGDLIA